MNRSLCTLVFLAATSASAQYTPSAGQNAPVETATVPMRTESGDVLRDDDGNVKLHQVTVVPKRDGHGNAQGNKYDLAVDGAFRGQTVLILDQVGNTLVNTVASLQEKGFNTVVFHNFTGPTADLKAALAKSCQVWLISAGSPQLSDGDIDAIAAFFDAGHGVYVWGDNDPLYVDANRLANKLVPQLGMLGDLPGDKVVNISPTSGGAGVRAGHLITTGLEHLYEGVTIATIHGAQELTPILYGSAGNLVTAAYDKGGKRLVIDGGFTRLAVSWDDAGTARYVKNAASWLVNAERFKEKVAKN